VSWTVYVLHSRKAARTYVGIALDPAARLAQHNGKARGGARSTRAGRPWRVRKTYGPFATRAEAQRVEHAVKRLRGRARFAWLPGEAGRRGGAAAALTTSARGSRARRAGA
jgi:predicted GIY-YIG superfamily endonuclease